MLSTPPGAPLLPTQRRILIVTDAWKPQVNGVVRTLSMLAEELTRAGNHVEVVGPGRFRNIPCPTYPDIRLALFPRRRLARIIDEARPNSLHIATEGPLGITAASLAKKRGLAFTTAYHTRFPEYVQARSGLPPFILYAALRRFHAGGEGMLVATESLKQELTRRGFRNIVLWSRGVDLAQFQPSLHAPNTPPVFLYVGRVAVEKNIRAFLALDLPGTKRVVGDGPLLAQLRHDYPQVEFTGALHGTALASAYAAADVFVFPSKTDTFGLVVLEALACGTPVAAYPVTGPKDVFANAQSPIGALNEDLYAACLAALSASRAACRAHAERFSWSACAATFAAALVPLHRAAQPLQEPSAPPVSPRRHPANA
jgi:glycosyltransferase involved in cell wall biosynthesis